MVTMAKENRRLSKGAVVGRARVEPDTDKYSGRVAARVRALRDKRGWSVEELAHKVGVADQTMYGYESGKRDIPPDLYPDLADAFGVTVRAMLPNE